MNYHPKRRAELQQSSKQEGINLHLKLLLSNSNQSDDYGCPKLQPNAQS